MNREQFDKNLTTFRKQLTNNMALGARLAQASGEHFARSGDVSYIADFYNTIATAGKNYVRKAAFLAWLVAHFPVKLEENKFSKDQELAAKMNWGADQDDGGMNESRTAWCEKAAQKSFFDFAPEKEIQNFSAGTIIELLEKGLKRLGNPKLYKAEDASAEQALSTANATLAELKTKLAPVKAAA